MSWRWVMQICNRRGPVPIFAVKSSSLEHILSGKLDNSCIGRIGLQAQIAGDDSSTIRQVSGGWIGEGGMIKNIEAVGTERNVLLVVDGEIFEQRYIQTLKSRTSYDVG
jgi:hypothetical protein